MPICSQVDLCIDHYLNNWYLLIEGLIFIRLFPFVPSAVINFLLACIGIKFKDFILASSIGCIPYNFYGVNIGTRLQTLHSVDDVFSVMQSSTAWAMAIGLFALLMFKWFQKPYSSPPPPFLAPRSLLSQDKKYPREEPKESTPPSIIEHTTTLKPDPTANSNTFNESNKQDDRLDQPMPSPQL